MNHKITYTVVERPILTPADELELEANDILADVVYGKSPYAEELEVKCPRAIPRRSASAEIPRNLVDREQQAVCPSPAMRLHGLRIDASKPASADIGGALD